MNYENESTESDMGTNSKGVDHEFNIGNDKTTLENSANGNTFTIASINMDAIVADKSTGGKRLVKVSIKAGMCVVCAQDIQNDTKSMACFTCGRIMHLKHECKFGGMQYTYRNNHHCSLPCYLKQEIYEVKIVGEITTKGKGKQRKYIVLYNNGTTVKHPAYKIESIAQYAKMVHDWKEAHPLQAGNYNDAEASDSDVEVTGCILAGSQPQSNKNKDNVCCMCNEVLTAESIRNCYSCKRRLHDTVICPMKHLMYADDDKLYCNDCKASVM
jgi:hypothetical protein